MFERGREKSCPGVCELQHQSSEIFLTIDRVQKVENLWNRFPGGWRDKDRAGVLGFFIPRAPLI